MRQKEGCSITKYNEMMIFESLRLELRFTYSLKINPYPVHLQAFFLLDNIYLLHVDQLSWPFIRSERFSRSILMPMTSAEVCSLRWCGACSLTGYFCPSTIRAGLHVSRLRNRALANGTYKSRLLDPLRACLPVYTCTFYIQHPRTALSIPQSNLPQLYYNGGFLLKLLTSRRSRRIL